MKVHLQGHNGMLDQVRDGIETILYDGDKIHFVFPEEKDSIVVGFTVNRKDYSIKSITEG